MQGTVEENIFNLKSEADLGSKEKRISFLMEQRKKRTPVFAGVGEPAGNETEKPQGKKQSHASQLRSVTLNDRLSMAIFKKHQ